ncbi:diadenylate cyclase CdaA [Hymenobacter bucti]|uniref:Diadenylate cyclase n=1 Tax=Hymenobacter bucti TaxID=1844114 RepID=A0ABW4QXQ2_9BACT
MNLPYPFYFLHLGLVDVADVLLVTVLLYQLYKLLRGSVALNVALGGLSVYLVYLLVSVLGLGLLSSILGEFMDVGVLAGIILFQQEIRRFLVNVGKVALEGGGPLGWWRRESSSDARLPLAPFVEAAKTLATQETGALICFARASDLSAYAESGDLLDAEVSKRLLLAIFQKTSPLHDGAVIIAQGRLRAARCILPVSQNPEVPAALGLRHRAALGLTEATDAIVLVVSEETGQVSLVRQGEIYRNLTPTEVKSRLGEWLHPSGLAATAT